MFSSCCCTSKYPRRLQNKTDTRWACGHVAELGWNIRVIRAGRSGLAASCPRATTGVTGPRGAASSGTTFVPVLNWDDVTSKALLDQVFGLHAVEWLCARRGLPRAFMCNGSVLNESSSRQSLCCHTHITRYTTVAAAGTAGHTAQQRAVNESASCLPSRGCSMAMAGFITVPTCFVDPIRPSTHPSLP